MPNKLNDQDVMHIRQHVADGGLRAEMRDLYQVSSETIARICRGDSHQQVRVRVMGEEELQKASAASQERLLKMLAEDTPTTGKKTASEIMEEAERLLEGLDEIAIKRMEKD